MGRSGWDNYTSIIEIFGPSHVSVTLMGRSGRMEWDGPVHPYIRVYLFILVVNKSCGGF